MAGQARVGDTSVGVCSIGADCCPHNWVGVAITGAPTCNTNSLPSCSLNGLVSTSCPHCPIGIMMPGSPNKMVNSLSAHRLGDIVTLGCGTGVTITGSPNANVN
jgi:uncharacterized Zn-binding protein involved in type VI secretion